MNVAGGFRWETLESGSLESWDALYAMNLRSTVVACREALPRLVQASGSGIVNVGALAAQKAGMGMGAYAASKAGVARLTEALAEELKDRGVRVNAVLPSILDTSPTGPTCPTPMPRAGCLRARWLRSSLFCCPTTPVRSPVPACRWPVGFDDGGAERVFRIFFIHGHRFDGRQHHGMV